MPKILVTGAAGFLGYYIARDLARSSQNEVICVDNFIRGEKDALYLELTALDNVQHIEADLTDYKQVELLPDDVDTVFHMAALNGTQNFYERPFEVVRSCTLPTMFLIEKYKAAKLDRFVYAGTSESYASTVKLMNWEVPTGEDVPVSISDVFNPRWSYAGSKMHGEIAVVNGCRNFGIPFTIIRYHNAYGPRMGDKHVIPDFYARARKGVFELYGYEDTRSFLYADDASKATIELAKCAGADGQIVNVGSPDEIKILDLGNKMMEVAGLHGDIICHPSPSGSVPRRAPKIDKLVALTGFEPDWTLTEGLKATASYYLGEG